MWRMQGYDSSGSLESKVIFFWQWKLIVAFYFGLLRQRLLLSLSKKGTNFPSIGEYMGKAFE